MMSKAILSLSVFLVLVMEAASQAYVPYNWDDNRSLTTLSNSEMEHGLYYIQVAEDYQYTYDPSSGQLVCYTTNHFIIRVNNDEALNNSNRVYIPMRQTLDLVDVNARAISPTGKITQFDQKNIKALEEDESGYKILAVEGAEVGGEIEYYYTRKTTSSRFKTRFFQYSAPIRDYQFTLTCPENLEYDFKVYNHETQVSQLEVDTALHINSYALKASEIPAILREDFSSQDNNKKRIEYKLAYNSASGKSRINTWGDAGVAVYASLTNVSTDEKKEVAKFIKKQKFSGNSIEQFRQFEHYIKTNLFYEEEVGDQGENLSFILQNRYGSERGFTKLYMQILEHLEIDYEIVMALDKQKRAFDPSFDSWNYLDEFLIYIPGIKQFLTPKNIAFRLGTVSDGFLGTKALFIRPEKVQDYIYPVAHIGDIPAPAYTENFDNLDIAVKFSDDMQNNEVAVTRSYKGYSAEYFKQALFLIEEDDKKEMLDQIIKYLALDAEIEQIEITEKNNTYDSWQQPFSVKGQFTTGSYIESAGDIILFKAGGLIGPQSELYQETERTTDVINQFNRGYLRKIEVTIPNGFTIQNPEDLIIKKQVFEGDKLIFNFDSNYTLNGQTLTITIDEFYDSIYYPKAKFEAFREVINSAADWNKIVLVLEES